MAGAEVALVVDQKVQFSTPLKSFEESCNLEAPRQRFNTIATRRLGKGGKRSGKPWNLANSAMTQVVEAQGFLAFASVHDACSSESPRVLRMVTKGGKRSGKP
ncbi:MAG: hypothetical protein OXH76_16240 [Boseongicola sp.]|nr:hypothetical protein [Boseongicola sp.]